MLSGLAMESKASWGYGPSEMEGWRSELTITASAAADHHLNVGEEDGYVIGFYMLCASPAQWTLEHLWVRPHWMRRGTGSMLMSHALVTAHHYRARRVRVVADPNAKEFYERAGGVLAGSVPAPLPGVPDRVLPIYEFETRAT